MSKLEANKQLQLLFQPKSVAVIGASEDTSTVGYALLTNLVKQGYCGTIYPVNPKYAGKNSQVPLTSSTAITPYLAAVSDLPDSDVTLAIVMTPSHTIVDILTYLGEKKVCAVVVISSGFNEVGSEGSILAQRMKEIANCYQMVLIGPNCLGIANVDPKVNLNATFARQLPSFGKGAMFSQSGAIGIELIERAHRLGLGLAQFVSLGNQVQIGPYELLQYWFHQPQVAYVLGYLESGESLAKIRDIATQFTLLKPILLMKSGRSKSGAKAAHSHTGSMAGNEDAVSAFCRQTGIQRFDTMTDFLAAAQIFEHAKPSVGNRVAIFSNAGGYAVLFSDELDPKLSHRHHLLLSELSPETTQQLAHYLPPNASIHNPVDTTATVPIDNLEHYSLALEALLMDVNVDACIVSLVPLMNMSLELVIKAVAQLQTKTAKPILLMLSASDDQIIKIRQMLEMANLPMLAIFSSVEESIVALEALDKHRRWGAQEKPAPVPMVITKQPNVVRQIFSRVQSEKRVLLTTLESFEVLAAYGLQIVPYKMVTILEEALEAAEKLNYPVVIKLNSKTVTHKTDIGAVRVDIRNQQELIDNFKDILKNLSNQGIASFEEGEGLMIQAFLSKGREIILGLKEDPDFGKLMMVGRGGIYTAIDKDVQFRLAPLTCLDVKEMVGQMKAYQILKGARGKPAVDIGCLEEALYCLNALALDFPEIKELDINPYMATPTGVLGNLVVDARIVVRT